MMALIYQANIQRLRAEKHHHSAAWGKLNIDATALPQLYHQRITEDTLLRAGESGASGDPMIQVNQVSEPAGASSGKSGILEKFDIEATALPQLHQLELTAQSHALGARMPRCILC